MANVLPLSGALTFTEIDSLSANIGALSAANLRLSEYSGQDFDIPFAPQPIKFSDFYGAINYGEVEIVKLTGVPASNAVYQTIAYKDSSQNIVVNPYQVICLSAVNVNTTLRTKKAFDSTSSTYVMLDTKVQPLLYGLLDENVTLWVQKNNESIQQTLKTVVSSANIVVTVGNNSYQSLINALDLSTVAPAYISAALALNNANNYTITNFSQNTVNQLIALANSQSTSIKYSVTAFNTQKVNINQITYKTQTLPLVTAVADVYDPASSQHWQANYGSSPSTTLPQTFTLSQFGAQVGDIFTLYMGPGPRTATSGAFWSSFTVTLSVLNNLKLHFS